MIIFSRTILLFAIYHEINADQRFFCKRTIQLNSTEGIPKMTSKSFELCKLECHLSNCQTFVYDESTQVCYSPITLKGEYPIVQPDFENALNIWSSGCKFSKRSVLLKFDPNSVPIIKLIGDNNDVAILENLPDPPERKTYVSLFNDGDNEVVLCLLPPHDLRCWKYEIGHPEWQSIAPRLFTQSSAAGCVFNFKDEVMYLGSDLDKTRTQIFDKRKKQWREGPAMPSGKKLFSTATIDENLGLMMGGLFHPSNTPATEVLLFDRRDNSFTHVGDLPNTLTPVTCGNWKVLVICTGGSIPNVGRQTSTYVFNVTAQNLTRKPEWDMPSVPGNNAEMVNLGDRLFLTWRTATYEFDPDSSSGPWINSPITMSAGGPARIVPVLVDYIEL